MASTAMGLTKKSQEFMDEPLVRSPTVLISRLFHYLLVTWVAAHWI